MFSLAVPVPADISKVAEAPLLPTATSVMVPEGTPVHTIDALGAELGNNATTLT